MMFKYDPSLRRWSSNMYWPVAMAAGLANSMEHVGLLTVSRQARENEHCGASRGFWVGCTGLVVHPVQRNLTTINSTDELTERNQNSTFRTIMQILLYLKKTYKVEAISQQEQHNRRFFLLAISDSRFGLDKGTDQGLKPPSPAPWSGTESFSHHRTVLVEEHTERLTTNQGCCLIGEDIQKHRCC